MARFIVEINQKSPLTNEEGDEVADDIEGHLRDCLEMTGLGYEGSDASSKLGLDVSVTFEKEEQ